MAGDPGQCQVGSLRWIRCPRREDHVMGKGATTRLLGHGGNYRDLLRDPIRPTLHKSIATAYQGRPHVRTRGCICWLALVLLEDTYSATCSGAVLIGGSDSEVHSGACPSSQGRDAERSAHRVAIHARASRTTSKGSG